MTTVSTPDPRLEAVGIAHAILTRRVLVRLGGMLDVEELKQDLAVHVLESLKYYRPERGSLRTFVGMTFDQWWKSSIRDRGMRRALEESRWEMPEVAASDARSPGMSARGAEIIAQLPPQTREVAEVVIAYGTPRKAAAEVLGIPYQTLNTRMTRAKKALREMAA